MENQLNGKTYPAFMAAVLIGGTNFVAVTFSNQQLPPFFGAALRFTLASMVFFLIIAARRVSLPDLRSSAGAALYGLFGFGTSYALLYYSLVELPAGIVSVIMATVPMFTLVLAVMLGQERFTVRGIVGSLLAVAGIVVLSLGTLDGDLNPSYLVASLFAAISASASSVVAKELPDVRPINMNAIGMASGAILLAAGSLLFGEAWRINLPTQSWLAVGWLVFFGSVGLFQLFLYVIKRWTASATSYAITAMPVVAVTLGALLLDQAVTVEMILGGVLVIVAVVIGAVLGKDEQEETGRGRSALAIDEAAGQ